MATAKEACPESADARQPVDARGLIQATKVERLLVSVVRFRPFLVLEIDAAQIESLALLGFYYHFDGS